MTYPQEYHWIFGEFDHIEFPNGGNPVPAPNSQMSTLEGLACISDASGTLLMYTDGMNVWDGSLSTTSQIATGLNGNQTSTQSGIIVPPGGANSDYHIFSVGEDDGNTTNKVYHSTYRPTGSSMVQILPVQQISDQISPTFDATERLGAVRHADGVQTWVLIQDEQNQTINAMLVSSDGRPSSFVASTSSLLSTAGSTSWEAGYTKVSHDGSVVAIADIRSDEIVLMAFNTTTGALTDMHTVSPIDPANTEGPYGLEFSPDNQTLYMVSASAQEIRAHTIANGAQPFSACTLISSNILVGALQLAPNGSIYGKQVYGVNLVEIQSPNTPSSPSFVAAATYADGTVITLNPVPFSNDTERAGLPNFTRFTKDDDIPPPEETCDSIAAGVNDTLSQATSAHENSMRLCSGKRPKPKPCKPLRLPKIKPQITITWGASDCDGVDSNDCEVMSITICNRYDNVTFTGLIANRITVLDANGDPVATLPNDSPSVTLAPIGPYCFGDIGPCSCVSRQFTLANSGALAGDYKIHIDGICFDVCLHQDTDACFTFEICED